MKGAKSTHVIYEVRIFLHQLHVRSTHLCDVSLQVSEIPLACYYESSPARIWRLCNKESDFTVPTQSRICHTANDGRVLKLLFYYKLSFSRTIRTQLIPF